MGISEVEERAQRFVYVAGYILYPLLRDEGFSSAFGPFHFPFFRSLSSFPLFILSAK